MRVRTPARPLLLACSYFYRRLRLGHLPTPGNLRSGENFADRSAWGGIGNRCRECAPSVLGVQLYDRPYHIGNLP